MTMLVYSDFIYRKGNFRTFCWNRIYSLFLELRYDILATIRSEKKKGEGEYLLFKFSSSMEESITLVEMK